MVPLKRLRTQLSIPLGLRHEGSTRAKRSLWWRKKRLVPVKVERQSTLYIEFISKPCPVVSCPNNITLRALLTPEPHANISIVTIKIYPPLSFRPPQELFHFFLIAGHSRCNTRSEGGAEHTLLHDRDVLLCEGHLQIKILVRTNLLDSSDWFQKAVKHNIPCRSC